MASRKAAKKRKPIITFQRVFLVFLIFALALAAYCVYLDNIVRSQFEGKRFALPARVYARPLEIFPGKTLALAELHRVLEPDGRYSGSVTIVWSRSKARSFRVSMRLSISCTLKAAC